MELSIFSILPFILLLLCIAIIPVISFKWWENNYFYIPLGFTLVTVIYLLIMNQGPQIIHSIREYFQFISILVSLYIISGGIYIRLKGYATPLRNVVLLFLGSILANLIGTTGASMLLIRPYIQTNKIRIKSFHIIFFIFIISNIGGALTPIGDPPLFLGYIKGIPFFWIIGKVFFIWLVTIVILIIVFYTIDLNNFRKQPERIQEEEERKGEKVKVTGLHNFVFLAVVIIAVFVTEPIYLRETIMLLAAYVSYKVTNQDTHKKNNFSFKPIIEVVWIFFGIFVTMIPALEILTMHAHDMNISSPTTLYWSTGILSSFLDNTPTYLTFLTASMGYYGLDVNNLIHMQYFISNKYIYVIAISVSSVFFGALTYIGNVPNYMVKAIAENQKVKLPGFFGYLAKYSLPILLPLLALLWLIFIL